MSAKTFEGSVSIVKNTKGEIALKRDPEGKFSRQRMLANAMTS